MLVSLTVGKVDAGVAVLLTEDKRLIEFPSILLPPDIHSGSIVDINVARNQHAELIAEQKFNALQSEIFETFGNETPSAPILKCRNTTQTSVVLEWDPINLATAELRSLSLYRNGTKAGVIPRDKQSTKISGLALDTEYTFHLVLRTSAGQYSSERLTIKTHKMTDLHGITITPGVMPAPLKDSLEETVDRVGAKIIDTVRIDTTHFVCTEPRGQQWEKAVEMNVPVVVPDWLKGCEREGRIVGVRGYYLDANPKDRQMGPSQSQQALAAQRMSVGTGQPVRDSPRIEHTPPTPERSLRDPESRPATASTGPPSPPPKPANGRIAEEQPVTQRADAGGPTVVAREAPASDEEEEDDSDDTENANDPAARPVSPQADTRKQVDQSSERDEASLQQSPAGADGKFDDVAL